MISFHAKQEACRSKRSLVIKQLCERSPWPWPLDPNINRGRLHNMTNLHNKFEDFPPCSSNQSDKYCVFNVNMFLVLVITNLSIKFEVCRSNISPSVNRTSFTTDERTYGRTCILIANYPNASNNGIISWYNTYKTRPYHGIDCLTAAFPGC